jgi:hypothetical protein
MTGALPASTAAQIFWSHHFFRRGQPESSAAPLPIQLGSHASARASELERSMPEPRPSHSVFSRLPRSRQGAAALPQRQSTMGTGSRACLAARASCACRWARRPVFSAPLVARSFQRQPTTRSRRGGSDPAACIGGGDGSPASSHIAAPRHARPRAAGGRLSRAGQRGRRELEVRCVASPFDCVGRRWILTIMVVALKA